jgi:molybdate transport system permease protein
VLGFVLVALVLLPVVSLVATASISDVAGGLAHPLVWPALRLSLITTLVALVAVVVCGTPLAWYFARRSTRLSRFLEAAFRLPIVLPPAVAGIALLLAFGRLGLFGPALDTLGLQPSLTAAAVILAQVFVSAPIFVGSATAAFRQLDMRLVDVAQTLGEPRMSALWRVALPLALPGLVAGAAMAWARALGEFGATLMFAGNLEGATQTLPLAIYTAIETDIRVAQAMSIVLVAVASLLLALVYRVSRPTAQRRGPGG